MKQFVPPYYPGPAQDHATVTPSDAFVFDPPFRRLYVGGAGDVVITSRNGVDAVYKNVPAGTTLQVAGTKVKDNAGETTATFIVAQF
ncbi:MAG: hypothetical protein KF782_10470 [Labilithrix sp.]|nr:hypothetical protein [Labilithrix sp.]